MDLINYYRLRKMASDDRSSAMGSLGAQLVGAGLTGTVLGGAGSVVGGLGTYAVADLINRIRYRNAVNKDVRRHLANAAAASIGAGVGGLAGAATGLYAGARMGKDLYDSATNKHVDLSDDEIDRLARRNAAKHKLYNGLYMKYSNM